MLTTVFFGTPSTAVPFLERLATVSNVLGVVTAPDKPAGRGYAVRPPPVRVAAARLGLPAYQPPVLRGLDWGLGLPPRPDVGLVVAYGKLIPASIFGAPRFGLINAHFSLLPRYRGAGPVQWALIRGERETGVTFFQIEAGLDTGPIYRQSSLPIGPEESAPDLLRRLTDLGVEMLPALLAELEEGRLAPTPQAGEASAAPLLTKDDGRVRWSVESDAAITNRLRGVTPWPGLFTFWRGAPLKILAARPLEAVPPPWGDKSSTLSGAPGRILGLKRGGILVQCSPGRLFVERVKPEGKKEMGAEEFWNGSRISALDAFEEG